MKFFTQESSCSDVSSSSRSRVLSSIIWRQANAAWMRRRRKSNYGKYRSHFLGHFPLCLNVALPVSRKID